MLAAVVASLRVAVMVLVVVLVVLRVVVVVMVPLVLAVSVAVAQDITAEAIVAFAVEDIIVVIKSNRRISDISRMTKRRYVDEDTGKKIA